MGFFDVVCLVRVFFSSLLMQNLLFCARCGKGRAFGIDHHPCDGFLSRCSFLVTLGVLDG